MQGVTGFSGGQRLHYQKPRTDLTGFKWRDSTVGGDDEMPPLMSPSAPTRAEPTPATVPSVPSMAVGTPVRLKGLNGPKHLNGCTGRIIGQEESRYQVELSDGSEAGKIKALKPQNLEEVGLRTAPAPVPRQLSHLSVGSRVRLVGLETRPEMNHRVGSIVGVQGSRLRKLRRKSHNTLRSANAACRMSGAADVSGWFKGENFLLNQVATFELPEELWTPEEQAVVDAIDSESGPGRWGVLEVPISDDRTGVDSRINCGAIALKDLNASGTATAILVTTFDWPEPGDIRWFQDQLQLPRSVEVTVCAHLWPQQPPEARRELWLELSSCFDTAVLHFTGMAEYSQPGAEEVEEPLEDDWVTSVHAKLMLLEFPDRLRMVITSANMPRRFWEVNNEVVWVKDFPRATGAKPLQRVLASEFSSVFSHFLVQILQKCPLNRLEAWLSRSMCFDLSCDGARLIASLPGEHLPAMARQGNQLVLRLALEEGLEEAGNLQVLLKRMPDVEDSSRWKWSLESQEQELVLGQLDEMSSSALRAAEDLNFRAYRGEMEVSLSTATEIDVERTKVSFDDEESKPVTSLRVLLKIGEDTELDMLQLTNEDWARLANLLALVEVDYGLFALRHHLSHEIWPPEEHYVALSGSIASLPEWWLQDVDRCCGRLAEDPGPQLVVPRHRSPLPIEYKRIYESMPGKLVEHRSPQQVPGRQKILNHGKLLSRVCCDEAGQRCGWIYVGSHNFTKSAWGSIWRPETEDTLEVLSSSNRELGVLLIQPPGSESRLISDAPWPFGFPLTPVEEEDLEFESEDEDDEAESQLPWEEQWNWSQWNWYQNWSWNGEDMMWEKDSDCESWQYHVRLEDGEEGDQDKLMKARNLELVTQANGPSVTSFAAAPTAPTMPTAATAKAPTAAVTPAVTPAPKAAVPPVVPQRPARPVPKLRDVLKAAKPSWTEKDLSAVVEKLLKAQVTGFAELRDALRATGSASLNERLRAAGQKVFAAETVAALKTRVDLEDPPKPVIEMNPDLPKQRWEATPVRNR
eukprot:s518_g11.t2